jgi:hypothetical protein
VTITLRRPVPAALDPVVDTLAMMNGAHPMDGLIPGLLLVDSTDRPTADVSDWTNASTLITGDRFNDMIATAERRWRAPTHVAAALAWKAYSYWVSLPAVVGYASVRRIPLLDPDSVALRFSDQRPFLCVALRDPLVAVLPNDPVATMGSARVRVVADDAAMLKLLHSSLVRDHLHPLVERIHRQSHLGRRTLWGSLASGVSHGLSRTAAARPVGASESTIELAGRLLDALNVADLVKLGELPDGQLTVARHTCCLAFALPEPNICSGCCIRTP